MINKTVFEDENYHYNLKEHIKALKAYGYSVTEEHTARNLSSDHNIIIAHPPWGEISDLHEFHEKNPEIPIIFYSALSSSGKQTKISKSKGFCVDSDGVYYSFGSSIPNLLNFVKYLNKVIYRNKNKI